MINSFGSFIRPKVSAAICCHPFSSNATEDSLRQESAYAQQSARWFGRKPSIALWATLALICVGFILNPTSAQDKSGPGGFSTFGALDLLTVGPSVEFRAEYELSDDKTGTISVTATLGPDYHIFSTTQPEGGTGLPTIIKLQGSTAELTSEFKPDRKPEIHKTEYSDVPLEEFYGSVTWTAPFKLNKDLPSDGELELKVEGQVCSRSCELVEEVVLAKPASLVTAEAPPTPTNADAGAGADAEKGSGDGTENGTDEAPPGMAALQAAPSKDTSNKSASPDATRSAPPSKSSGLFSKSTLSLPNRSANSSTIPQSNGEISLRVENTHAVWSAQVVPSSLQPGESGILMLSANCDPGYHVYKFVPGDDETTFRTLIVVTEKSGIEFGTPQTDSRLITDSYLDEVQYYGGNVVWKIPFQVPKSSEASPSVPFAVEVGFLTCNEGSCDEPTAVKFSGTLAVGESGDAVAAPLNVSQVKYNEVADHPALTSWIDGDVAMPNIDTLAAVAPNLATDSSTAETDGPETAGGTDSPLQSLTPFHVLAALTGGFILNFMPCVLPVIGLKVMSFMEQGGNSRGRVVGLNLAYVGGILAVMLALALLTVGAKLFSDNAFGWGEQFTVLEFKVALACLVFAMALSFLGVWEIPIPGFATTSKSGELMEKEGPLGAFLKGILTTILATPCSGPLLGSLFGLSLVLSPISVIMLYLLVGIGMGSPFLVLCIWPGFMKFLPKPGAWMETLKQALAFPLLFTVVFFVASITNEYRIATLILLMVVWFACWLIGRVPAYAERSKIRTAWISSLAVIGLGAVISFAYFGPTDSELKWVPYNETELAKFRSEGKTIMLDFTANWCLTCQVNTRVAIDKESVAELVAENDVVPMLADWTDRSDEIRDKLEELQSNSIPLLVIYPPDPSAKPILLRDLITESQVLEALEQAGPSQSKSLFTSTIY